jgi:phytoene/squalene synthetase
MALHDKMYQLKIPVKPFLDLLKAFRKDVLFIQPENWNDIANYCKLSANPIGELVLRIFNNYNQTTAPYSDAICTGLQLTNFWQDLSRDIPNKRFYIPNKILENFGLQNKDLVNRNKVNNLVLCLDSIFEKTDSYFNEGRRLIGHLDSKRLRSEIKFTIEGGIKVLDQCKEKGIKLLDERPSLNKMDLLKILLKVLF